MTDMGMFHQYVLLLILLGAGAGVISSCSPSDDKPDPDSEEYRQGVSDFYISLAAIESDEALFAVEKMRAFVEQFPAEPAGRANLGVFAMRQGNFELATQHIEEALSIMEGHADLIFLAGILESRKGNISGALEYFREAARLDPEDPRKLFMLAEELERQGADDNAGEIMELLDQILQKDPENIAVRINKIRLAAKLGYPEEVNTALAALEEQAGQWPEGVEEQFQNQKKAILEKQGENISYEIAFLRNSFSELPQYKADVEDIRLRDDQMGFLFTDFIWLPNREETAAPADHGLAFHEQETDAADIRLHKALALGDEQQTGQVLLSAQNAVINGSGTLSFPGKGSRPLSPYNVVEIDIDDDFLNDIALVGPDGLKIYRQQEDAEFEDITASSGIGTDVTDASFAGGWTVDIELDGDLDLLLARQEQGSLLLRNNGDGSLEVQSYFENVPAVREVLFADFDMDGDADILLQDNDGEVYLYRNEREGRYSMDSSFSFQNPLFAVAFADVNSDGLFEIIGWERGQVTALQFDEDTAGWTEKKQLVDLNDATALPDDPVNAQILIGDLDNNGAVDILLSHLAGSTYWLADQYRTFDSPGVELPVYTQDLADVDGDSRLDMLGIGEDQQEALLLNQGSENYNGRMLYPRSSGLLGDRRINSFGIGGEIETRSGLQYSKQSVRRPWVHVGLGTYEEAEMVRIIWPNGTAQAEFAELGYDNQIMNEQILKGSCPWIYTYNGEEMEFVTDFLWKTSLGLKINDQGESSVLHSVDWIKIEDQQLKPRKGYYDIRITADLWESHFFDHISLMAVDHPKETSVFVDERFVLPAPEQKLYPMQQLDPVETVRDYTGKDITSATARLDEVYSTIPPLTMYQGVAEEYYIEIDLGPEPDRQEKQWLIASGWVYPTDTSINVALNQGNYSSPTPLEIRVPDGTGGWKTVRDNIGFPSGKDKTILIDLDGVFEDQSQRTLRLYTTMELYWDQFQIGTAATGENVQSKTLAAEGADLGYRGFSKMENTGRFEPTRGNYQILSSTAPKWFNLEGYYTRFGEVRELIDRVDDRYVIMNAGDELKLKFPALDPPKEGWSRTFVLVGDGWIKDGDFNTGHSRTLRPLPYHGLTDYTEPPGSLSEEPVYQQHWKDWVQYHTRYVEAKRFNASLGN